MNRALYKHLLGTTASLRVARFGPPGAFLALDDDPSSVSNGPHLLLPGAEIPEGIREGNALEVFVYLDSEDRPVATLREPKIELDEVAFLTVTDVTRIGAFVDWGMPKELLVPYAEQTRELRRGDRHPIGLFLDDTGRLAGTMRVSEMLRDRGDFQQGEWVEGEAWRDEPMHGLFVIVERAFVGLVPRSEPHRLSRGEPAKLRVANVLPDGKIELSLRGLAHEELDRDAETILARLRSDRAPRLSDRSDPDAIRAAFGLTKKAFKRAVGRLLKQGHVAMDASGIVVARRR